MTRQSADYKPVGGLIEADKDGEGRVEGDEELDKERDEDVYDRD